MYKEDIGSRFRQIREQLNVSQKKMSQELNVSQNLISKYESGVVSIRDDNKQILAEKFNVNLKWLITGEGNMFETDLTPAQIKIPILDVECSAGFGVNNLENPAIVDYFDIQKHLLRGYDPKTINAFKVRGDSMEPTLRDEDYVLCALGKVSTNGIYVININGSLLVKRIQFIRREKIIVMSDNKMYKDEEITPDFADHFAIVGKVIYHVRKV